MTFLFALTPTRGTLLSLLFNSLSLSLSPRLLCYLTFLARLWLLEYVQFVEYEKFTFLYSFISLFSLNIQIFG